MQILEPTVLMQGNATDIGITARKNKNGYVAIDLGMGADPETFTPDVVAELRASMEPWKFEKEHLRNWDAQSGQPVFQASWVAVQKARAREPVLYLDTEPEMDGQGEPVRDMMGRVQRKLVRKDGGRIRIYIEPHELGGGLPDGVEYVERACAIGADVGAGVGGSDSAAVVMFAGSKEQAAEFNCNEIEPAEFGRLLVLLAKYYNNAVVCPAAKMHGIAVIRAMCEVGYGGRVWRHCPAGKLVEVPNEQLGWRRGESSDELLFGRWTDAIQNDTVILHGLTVIEQLGQYIYDEHGRVTMQSLLHLPVETRGRHGDLVIAAALCYRACLDMPMYEVVELVRTQENTAAWRLQQHAIEDRRNEAEEWR